ncbi:MAG TPA: hypothetical protein PLP42_07180 [Acidobacteriota bacterium]|nr:hypothetical protein [Acidobacteriota bacterium]
MALFSRRQLISAGLSIPAAMAMTRSSTGKPNSRRLADVGWVWEGQAFRPPGVYPSIFGAGEGAEYFGLSRVVFLFHPNTELAMEKLSGMKEVVCDISKWKYKKSDDGWVSYAVDADPENVIAEAEHVSRLAQRFPNIVGGYHDDMRGLAKRENYKADQYARIYRALKSHKKDLRLWVVVYSHELPEVDFWREFSPFIDVVSLWVWEAKNLRNLDQYLADCRKLFPDKPINIGCYLRDYPNKAPVSMDLLKFQWDWVLRNVASGAVDGYEILGAFLIDGQQEQARWVRDFIAAN